MVSEKEEIVLKDASDIENSDSESNTGENNVEPLEKPEEKELSWKDLVSTRDYYNLIFPGMFNVKLFRDW